MNNSDVYNEHLNVFNYYSRGKTCEDNLSRILAKILIEEQYKKFHDEFLNLIGMKGNIDYVFSHIGSEKIKRYITSNNINIVECIPVTLTDRGKKIDNESSSKSKIPDIVLKINNKLVFIEVKLGTTIPEKQVMGQIKKYLNDKDYNGKIIKIYWEDIIKKLSKLYSNDFFIKDYLQLIDSNHSNWFDYSFVDIYKMESTKKDNKGNIIYKNERDLNDKNNLINIRISKLLENYCKQNKIRLHSHFYKRRAFPLVNSFTTEMQLRFNQNQNRLEAHIWTGELVDYTKEFNEYYKNNSELIKSFINFKDNKYDAKCFIIPYVLFRDHFAYLSEFNIDNKKNTFIPKELCDLLCGRKKYTKYKKIVEDNIIEIEKYIKDFRKYFDYITSNFYTKSKRTNLTISIGYDVVISYPQESYFKLDEENKLYLVVDDCINLFNKYFGTRIEK